MGLEAKAQKAFNLKAQYILEYDNNNIKEAKKLEIEYLTLRREVLIEIDSASNRQRSEPISAVKERIENRKKPKRIETGITELDRELVDNKMKMNNISGGFTLGNFIQIAGSRGSGKSSIMMKILTGFSNYEKTCWFDFEMGESRVVEKLHDFTHNDDNLLYYSSSRKLEDVVSEIKLLNAIGVNHFVIDSAMKITVPNLDNYNRFSAISSELSELTSSLNINIYMINQMSQESEKTGILAIKHGNDAEYDADFIFYIMKMKAKDRNDKFINDSFGMPVYDENNRLLKCTKNRQDDRLFSISIDKKSIFQNSIDSAYGFPVEIIEYSEGN